MLSSLDQLVLYGKSLLKQNPKACQIRDRIVNLQGEYRTLTDVWQRRDKELQQSLDLLVSYGPILSYPILSYPILSYPILSYPILSYPVQSYPILSYLICDLQGLCF